MLYYICPVYIVIHRKARGEIVTTATWMRDFVSSHPQYKRDSVISQEVAYDLLMRCKQVGEGGVPCPEILGDIIIDRLDCVNNALVHA